MLRQHIRLAFRRIANDKNYSFINFVGLTAGVAVCILLFLWIHDELRYDRFHENADRIYRFQWEGRFGDNEWKIPQVPVPLAEMVVREFPEVERATRAYEGKITFKLGDDFYREKQVLYVDEHFFDVFTVQTLAGDARSVAANPDAVILTPVSANRYFGSDIRDYNSLIGRSIQRNDGKSMLVAGVVAAFPSQSHLKFDFLASLKSLQHIEQRKDQWASASCLTYFLARKGASVAELPAKIADWTGKNPAFESTREGGNYSRFPFEPITQIHIEPNRAQVWMFGITGIFILALACFNFINLSTAKALTRAREVGVRKTLGSQRAALISQFFGESAIFVLISVAAAIATVGLTLPYFNKFADKTLSLGVITQSPVAGLFLLGLTLFTAILTGVIPAVFLSSFTPIKVLKGALSGPAGGGRVRQTLVVGQFFISSALIIGTLVVKRQLDYLQNRSLGFDKEHVLVLRNARSLGANYNPFIAWLRSLSGIENASSAMYLPGDGFDSTVFAPEQPANYKETSLSYDFADWHFVKTMGLQLVSGRDFNQQYASDSAAYIINQTAARKLGWDNPIGKKISDGYQEGQVIGVVSDFNFASLHEEVDPILLRIGAWSLPNIVVRLRPGDPTSLIEQVRGAWKNFSATAPFDYVFLDQQIQKLYEREQRMAKVFLFFTALAVLIACLGLAGLAAFMALQRVKEIGVRKVLGASTASVMTLLTKDFLLLVSIALLLAIPVAWWAMNKWLSDFAYRIEIGWQVCALTVAVTVGISFLTVSFQSVKAAMANPVKSLRNE